MIYKHLHQLYPSLENLIKVYTLDYKGLSEGWNKVLGESWDTGMWSGEWWWGGGVFIKGWGGIWGKGVVHLKHTLLKRNKHKPSRVWVESFINRWLQPSDVNFCIDPRNNGCIYYLSVYLLVYSLIRLRVFRQQNSFAVHDPVSRTKA